MSRRMSLVAIALGFGLTGCAEFDGFYDDDMDLVERRGAWIDRVPDSNRPDADQTGAYGGPEIRR